MTTMRTLPGSKSLRATFRSLANPDYRLWASGAILSNIGTWMQRTAQYWLVLTELTDNNAAALGLVLALQSAPQVLLLPLTGYAADHFSRRTLLIITQILMGSCGLALGLLTLSGVVALWHVYILAFIFGCVNAFDTTSRQTFVSDLVGEADLPNAVALNSTSMTTARLIGPAIAGLLIAVVGTGWVFLINAASFLPVIASLFLLRTRNLHSDPPDREKRTGSILDGFAFVRTRGDLKLVFFMFFLMGTFGYNFPVFISTMSVSVFRASADEYGFLMSMMAIGALSGALLAAGRSRPTIRLLKLSAGSFAVACLAAAFMPNYLLFGLALVAVGTSAQTFSTSANSLVQLSVPASVRGRVMAILLAIALGGTPIGAPIAGYVADAFGARWAMGIGAAAGLVACLWSIVYLRRFGEPLVRPEPSREPDSEAESMIDTL